MADGWRARDCIAFLADTERDMVQRMKAFLRDELGCRALVSNASSWTCFATDQSARDDLRLRGRPFLRRSPAVPEQSWRLPSRCPNTSPIADRRDRRSQQHLHPPLRQAIHHHRIQLLRPRPVPRRRRHPDRRAGRAPGLGRHLALCLQPQPRGHVQTVAHGLLRHGSDPLSQAAERASLCLFLRGDLQTAPHRVALAMTDADLAQPPRAFRACTELALARLGDPQLAPRSWPPPDHAERTLPSLPLAGKRPPRLSGRKERSPSILIRATTNSSGALQERGIVARCHVPIPPARYFQSETGEVTIDGPRDILVLDTARTAGGYAPAGQVSVPPHRRRRSAWRRAMPPSGSARSMPIRSGSSRRLLVTHLTDLQNTEHPLRRTGTPNLARLGSLAAPGARRNRRGFHQVGGRGPVPRLGPQRERQTPRRS